MPNKSSDVRHYLFYKLIVVIAIIYDGLYKTRYYFIIDLSVPGNENMFPGNHY